jgi:hypothetical protein
VFHVRWKVTLTFVMKSRRLVLVSSTRSNHPLETASSRAWIARLGVLKPSSCSALMIPAGLSSKLTRMLTVSSSGVKSVIDPEIVHKFPCPDSIDASLRRNSVWYAGRNVARGPCSEPDVTQEGRVRQEHKVQSSLVRDRMMSTSSMASRIGSTQ